MEHTPQRPPPPPGTAAANAALAAVTPPQMSHLDFKVYMDRYMAANAGDPAASPAPVVQQQDPPSVDAVQVKLPTFWMADPTLWFHQCEAVFRTRTPKITLDSTKFDHVMSHLPDEVLSSIRHIIRLPHTTPGRYNLLKTTLEVAYGKSPSARTKELLEFVSIKEDLIDPKPSVAMLYIRDLAGTNYDAVERAMFLIRMPAPVRTALANSRTVDNDQFAAEANGIMEEYLLTRLRLANPSVNQVAACVPPTPEIPAEVHAVGRRPPRPLPPPQKRRPGFSTVNGRHAALYRLCFRLFR